MERMVFKWAYQNMGGISQIVLDGDFIRLEVVSGNDVHVDVIRWLLWSHPALEELRRHVKTLTRKNRFVFKVKTGMSGCADWYILTEARATRMLNRKFVMHISMYDKVTIQKDVWVKDVYDLLWYWRWSFIYENSSNPETEEEVKRREKFWAEKPEGLVVQDITENVDSQWKQFNDHGGSFDPSAGFGSDDHDSSEKVVEEDDEIVDYSNYVPVEEE